MENSETLVCETGFFGVNYMSIFDLTRGISPGTWLFGADVRDCFWTWALSPMSRRLFGINIPGLPMSKACYLFTPQGYKGSPGVNDSTIKEINRALNSFFPQISIFDFVDDLRGYDAHNPTDFHSALQSMELFRLFYLNLGVPLHPFQPKKPEKFIYPTTSCDWIGFHVDTIEMEVSLDESNRITYMKTLRSALDKFRSGNKTVTAKELSALIGQCIHATEVVNAGTLYLGSLYKGLNESGAPAEWGKRNKKANPSITITDAMYLDIKWWYDVLADRPRKPIQNIGGETFITCKRMFEDGNLLKHLKKSDAVHRSDTDRCQRTRVGGFSRR